MVYVGVNVTKNKVARSFTVTGSLFDVVKRYSDLRPTKVSTNRYFLNYVNGKCTAQVIGKNKFCKMPSQIARFLNLDDPDSYTGNIFTFG